MKKGAGRGHWIAAARNRSLRACLLPVPSLVYARSRRPCRGGHRPPVSQGGGAVSRASTARPYHLCPNGRGTKELCNRSRRPCRGGHRPPVSRGGGAVSRASTARPYHLCSNGRGDKYRKPAPAIFSGAGFILELSVLSRAAVHAEHTFGVQGFAAGGGCCKM